MLDYERANLLGLADREQQLARTNRQLFEDSRRDSLTRDAQPPRALR